MEVFIVLVFILVGLLMVPFFADLNSSTSATKEPTDEELQERVRANKNALKKQIKSLGGSENILIEADGYIITKSYVVITSNVVFTSEYYFGAECIMIRAIRSVKILDDYYGRSVEIQTVYLQHPIYEIHFSCERAARECCARIAGLL